MTPPPAVAEFQAAARRLGDHPQDHGWRELYRLFDAAVASGQAPELVDLVATAAAARSPTSSPSHLVTVVGIAVRSLAGQETTTLIGTGPIGPRLRALEELLARHRSAVRQLVARRQNSFTGARRFLVPQVLLAAYFARRDTLAHIADLGTGLGIMPRQLNSRTLFHRYAPDLPWPEGQPSFAAIPLGQRHGVDRGPLPDLSWVRTCYGPSAYYDTQYQELLDALAVPEVADAPVRYHEFDLADTTTLARFITAHRINTAVLCYSLYQFQPVDRAAVVDTLAATLDDPGLILIIEPTDDLTRPGCVVTIQDRQRPDPRPVCIVSDGHFRGRVTLAAGYREFVADYPIRFEPPLTGAVDAAARDHDAG